MATLTPKPQKREKIIEKYKYFQHLLLIIFKNTKYWWIGKVWFKSDLQNVSQLVSWIKEKYTVGIFLQQWDKIVSLSDWQNSRFLISKIFDIDKI